jgi:hypothetical protein
MNIKSIKHAGIVAIAASLLALSVTNNTIDAATPANRGRIQIQGPDVEKRLGKDALSFPWSQDSVISKTTALEALDGMVKKLTKSEATDRADAIKKAKKFINDAPASGVDSLTRSWGNQDVSAKRVDIEVITGKAFSN